MSGGGGKGGQSVNEIKLPKSIEKAAEQNLKLADEVSKIGYVPYSGPTVAALNPAQRAEMQNASNAASAFNMATPQQMAGRAGGRSIDPFTGLAMDPTLTGGVLGYSPMGIYDSAKANIPSSRDRQSGPQRCHAARITSVSPEVRKVKPTCSSSARSARKL